MNQPDPTRTHRWWNGPFSVFQTNLQEIDATMDVDAALDVIEGHGADTWLLNAGGIVSFHPTDLSFQTRNPFLAGRPSGDLVGDSVSAAAARGIRVVARLDLSKVAGRVAADHPDWLFLSPTGEHQVDQGLSSACPSGDYYQHRSLDIIDELLDRYRISGFFLNWFNFNEWDYRRRYHGVCHCDACKAGFSDMFPGAELPKGMGDEGYPQWAQFAGLTRLVVTQRMVEHLAARDPNVALVVRSGATIAYQEASNAFGSEVWHHATGEAVSAHTTASPDVPLLMNCVAFVDMPYRMAAEQPERYAHYFVQTVARGGHPSTYIMGAPGRIPYPNVDAASEITRFHRRHAELYAELRSAATVALVQPSAIVMGPGRYRPAVDEFRGILTSFQETHLPFDVLPMDAIAAVAKRGDLARYSLVVLPNLGPVGPDAAAALDEFVASGGNLVMTGSSAMTDDGASELACGPAAHRIGEALSGEALWATFATDTEQPDAAAHRYAAPIVPVYGTRYDCTWKADAVPVGTILPPAPFGPPEKCYGHLPSSSPAVATRRHGAGHAVTIPWTIGTTFRELGTTEIRSFLLRVVRPLVNEEVVASLPEQVEVIVGRRHDDLVVHLVNLSGRRERSFGPHLTVTGGSLLLGSVGAGVKAEALVAGHPLEVVQDGDGVRLDLPPLELFEVVRVEAG